MYLSRSQQNKSGAIIWRGLPKCMQTCRGQVALSQSEEDDVSIIMAKPKFAAARVKKLMQEDDDVGRVAAPALTLVSK